MVRLNMTDDVIEADQESEASGLYLPDCEIARRLGYGRSNGYKLLKRLDRGIPGMRGYPQPDPVFGRRFWPAVLEWHLDYHRVRRTADEGAAPLQPKWTENFDATPDKTRRPERARPQLAGSRG